MGSIINYAKIAAKVIWGYICILCITYVPIILIIDKDDLTLAYIVIVWLVLMSFLKVIEWYFINKIIHLKKLGDAFRDNDYDYFKYYLDRY